MMPEASTRLQPLPDDPGVQYWPTSDGRSVAVYRFAPSPACQTGIRPWYSSTADLGRISATDRDFLAGFARDGFEVVLYDQFGSGRFRQAMRRATTTKVTSPICWPCFDCVGWPAVLLLANPGGAAVITSALQSPRAHNWACQVVD